MNTTLFILDNRRKRVREARAVRTNYSIFYVRNVIAELYHFLRARCFVN